MKHVPLRLLALSFAGLLLAEQLHAEAKPAALLLRDGLIFTVEDEAPLPFRGHLVVDHAGKIAAVGPGEPAAEAWKPEEEINAEGSWVLPGFVSAHSHLWQSAYRGLASDQTLMGWVGELYRGEAARATPEDFYWFTLHGALDHLRHGITAAYNFNYSGWRRGDFATRQFEAETASGIRFVHGHSGGRVTETCTLEEARAELDAFLAWVEERRSQSPGLIAVMLNGAAAFTSDARQAHVEAALMREFGLGNHLHYLESPPEKWEEQAKFRWFLDAGLVNERAIFGHFIHVTPLILGESVRAGAAMSWNPLSNGRLASGTPDIVAYRRAGLRIGLGVDGQASADLADPFENMRAGLYAVRARAEDATALAPRDVLRMHTLGAAEVLGAADRIGSLAPGKFADFIVLDPRDLGPVFDPHASLVFAASSRMITSVRVGGRELVGGGKPLGHDWEAVSAELARRVPAPSPSPVASPAP